MMDNRAKFETWYSDNGQSTKAIERSPDGEYKLMNASLSFIAFQAGAESAEKQRDELLCELSKHQRHAAIGRAVERASEVLPEGFDLHIELEKDAGTVRLYYPDGEEATDEFHEGDHFANYIDNAINVAIANAKGA